MSYTTITNINDIPDLNNEEQYHSNRTTQISQKFHIKLSEIIAQLEAETGKIFRMELTEAKSYFQPIEIYPIVNRLGPYRVVALEEIYSDINGVYPTMKEIKDKLEHLNAEEFKQNFQLVVEKSPQGYVWKCPKCQSYGKIDMSRKESYYLNKVPTNPYNLVSGTRCINCLYSCWSYGDPYPHTVWTEVGLSPDTMAITRPNGIYISDYIGQEPVASITRMIEDS